MKAPGQALALALTLFGTLSCQRESPSQPPHQKPKAALAPWTWHALGGLLVIEGEVDQPTELVLKGTTLNERNFVEYGPIRWELYRPPKGEKAELRRGDGTLLARWDFDRPLPIPAPTPPKAQAKPIPPPQKAEATTRPEPPKTGSKKPQLKAPEPKIPAPARPKAPPPPPVQAEPRKPEPRKSEPKPPEPHRVEAPKPPAARPPQPQPSPVPAPIPRSGGTWPGSGEGLNLLRGPRGQRQVCLTFDGGSTSEVALDVLDALSARKLRSTFFLTGAFIQKYPELVRRIDQDGHEIGNHTLTHPHLAPRGVRDPRWTKERFQQELLAADLAFFRLMGRPMDPLWRAPYGEHTAEIRKWAEELGYRHVGWSEGADTLDWATLKERKLYRTGNAILDRLHTRMERQDGEGLIVLMHLGSGRPAEDRPARVLGPFLDRALANGWRFECVGTYLKATGKPSWDRNHRAALLVSSGVTASAAGQR